MLSLLSARVSKWKQLDENSRRHLLTFHYWGSEGSGVNHFKWLHYLLFFIHGRSLVDAWSFRATQPRKVTFILRRIGKLQLLACRLRSLHKKWEEITVFDKCLLAFGPKSSPDAGRMRVFLERMTPLPVVYIAHNVCITSRRLTSCTVRYMTL